jgi:Putative zinc-finger
MTPARLDVPEPPPGTYWHASVNVLARYAAGELNGADVWSVETHMAQCETCRADVSAHADGERLARNRAVVLALTAAPAPGWLRRLARRCGFPDHLLVLLSATSSLRRSWLLSVVAVLGVVTGEALLVRALRSSGAGGVGYSEPSVLTPFLLVGPLLVLAGVGAAFMPAIDPGHRLAVAAPFSSLTLLLVRAVSALLAALGLVVCAAVVVPGPGWLPAALLLPSLALCAFALAAATVLSPAVAVVTSGVLWVVPVGWLAVTRSPLDSVQVHGQSVCAAVVVTAVAFIFVRRDRLEMRWAS